YEATSGRYAAFFLGQINQTRKNLDKAEIYYKKAVQFSESAEAFDTGYYHYSLLSLGEIAARQGNKKKAREYFKKVKKHASRGDRVHKEARQKLKEL
ncbi:MAG: tol-pal system protein YbgF, partial [Bacteroidota bacterium]